MTRQDRPFPLPFEEIPTGAWIGPARVRFGHCDPAGIVYFPRFFELAHALIEDWMEQALGLSHADMTRRGRIGLGYGHAAADYFSPAFDGDRLQAAVLLGRIGNSSLGIRVPMYRGRQPIVTIDLVMVTTSLDTMKAIALPPDLRTSVTRYEARGKEERP